MTDVTEPNAAEVRAAELVAQLSEIVTATRNVMESYADAGAQLLASAEPDVQDGIRLPYEDYQAVLRSSAQRYAHTVSMADQLRDALASMADVAYQRDTQTAWEVYRRKVAAPLTPPEVTA